MTILEKAKFSASLEALAGRILASSEDRPAWLAARGKGVTATEIAKLAKGSAASRRELIASKLSGGFVDDLAHVPRIAQGRAREADILAWLHVKFGAEPNHFVFRARDEARHLATPDGLHVDFDDRVSVDEVKTSKFDLDPEIANDDPSHPFISMGYADQVQWQIYVMGALDGVFAWDQHDDDWSGWPEVAPASLYDEPRFRVVQRDDYRIDQLVAIADEFLEELDAARDGQTVTDPLLELRVERYLAKKDEAARAEEELRSYLSAQSIESASTAFGTVSFKVGSARRSFDSKAFQAEHPVLYKRFMKQGSAPSKPSLRVTTPKEKSE